MATDKRERQRANRQARIEAERREESSETLKQRVILGVVVAAVVLGGLFLISLGGGDDDTPSEEVTSELTLGTTTTVASEDTVAPEDAAEPTDGLESAVSAPAAGDAVTGETECPAEDGSSERVTSFESAPPMCIDATKSYTAEVATNLGTFSIELDAAAAPETVNNFVVLARYHYYDGAPFHRIIPEFVIQGGDAVGEPLGTGNPGYAISDELPAAGEYEIGSVAMANSGPNTSGSQFFVITGDNGAGLPPQYSLFGSVSTGMDVVTAIESLPTNSDDAPTEPVVIESVTITES